MNYTRNYQFKKQELTDPSDIRTMGENLDSIDNALSNLNGNVSGSVIKTVTESTASLPTIEANDTIAVASGKINKSLADLDASKLDAENVVNNLTTTSSGYALDARQGKALNDALNGLIKNTYISGGTITDTIHGFIDTGISSADYAILCAYALTATNTAIRISNLNNGGNYRAQMIDCVANSGNGAVIKSGTHPALFFWYVAR